MNQYKNYMDRQRASDGLHRRLLALEPAAVPVRKRQARWPQLAALAACCALILGVGLWRLSSPVNDIQSTPPPIAQPVPTATPQADYDSNSFVADSGEDLDKMMFPSIPGVEYADLTDSPEVAHSIALPDGSYTVDLTEEQICLLLWGSQERLDSAHSKEKPGNLPWMLCWDGYTISGQARYDGSGHLWQVMIFGNLDDSHSFELRLAPGQLPPTCVVEDGAAVTEVFGVEVSAWERYYDRNGDQENEHVYTSAFLVEDIGIRFRSISQEDSLLSSLFIRWAAVGNLTLDHLLINGDIPAWREERFTSLIEAREESNFAPYLPQADFSGYGEFTGHLSYQEGNYNHLFVRWSWGLDDVYIMVCLPEGEPPYHDEPVDVSVPESYDVRMYAIPWASSVPDAYRLSFSMPTFRAEDMSLAVVEARGYTPNEQGDTNSLRINFQVLHENGTLVQYSSEGLSAQQVWELVAPTLEHTG